MHTTKSLFEGACRDAVQEMLGNDIPVRNQMHKYMGEPILYEYAYDRKINNGKGRTDIFLRIHYKNRVETVGIECKTGMRDLTSGNGLNFDSDINYIIFPQDASEYIADWQWKIDEERIENYLFEKKIFGIGILMLDKSRKIKMLKRSARRDEAFGYLGICTEIGDY